MIAQQPADITAAALAAYSNISDDRQRQITLAAIEHLHAFVTRLRLTEVEFQTLCQVVAQLGQATNPTHNEVVLGAGSLGISALVCMLNNQQDTQSSSSITANLMGPFWREGAPQLPQGASIVRSPAPGDLALDATLWLRSTDGTPLVGADVHVWQASTQGFYENQDPAQADMNLRGRFTSDEHGCVRFQSIKPKGYPIPVDGPVGTLLRAAGRHNMRPAHVHVLVNHAGFKTQFCQLYADDDPHLETDAQFGVMQNLVVRFVSHPATATREPYCTLEHTLVLQAGEPRLPKAPITGKATGPLPILQVLQAR